MKLKGISQNLRLFVKMCNKDINSTNLNEIFLPFCTPTKIWNSFSGLPDGAYTTYSPTCRYYFGEVAGYQWRDRK